MFDIGRAGKPGGGFNMVGGRLGFRSEDWGFWEY